MATLYITSTANTGTGTLRTLISRASDGDTIQPDPTLFPKGTLCNVSLTATLSITKNLTIQGGQTRLVISSSGSNFYIEHGSSNVKPGYVNYTDVNFRGFYTTSSGAIRSSNCASHTFLRCSFCGIKGYTAPVTFSYLSVAWIVFQDCAFYGNIATQNSSNAGGALYFASATIAEKCSLINCTMGANYRAYNSSRYNYSKSPVVVNLVSTAAQEAQWKTPPASTYGYSTWTATSYQTMNPRPSASASWRTGATSTSSTIDLAGYPRKTNGALGAFEYYVGKLATPTNLTAYNITTGGFTLTWSNVTNANSYKVTCNGVTTTVYSNVKTFTGLSPLTTYPVTVVACDSNGDYLDSDAATTSVTTPEGEYLPPITPPPSIVDALISANGLYFEWNQPTGTAYVVVKIYQGSTPGTVLYNHTFDATYNSYTYSPVVANQAYIIGLQALPIEDSEKWSPSEESYSDPYSYGSTTQLNTPTNLASSNITNNSATVSWSGDDRATQFKVEYRASGASTWEEKLVTA